jgi:hypothetical protein
MRLPSPAWLAHSSSSNAPVPSPARSPPLIGSSSVGHCGPRSPTAGPLEQHAARNGHRVVPFSSMLATAVMVLQLRVVAGTPKTRSNSPR